MLHERLLRKLRASAHHVRATADRAAGRCMDCARILGLDRRRAYVPMASLAGVLVLAGVLLIRLFPAPPKRIVIATAAAGTSFEAAGQRYREILARSGIDVELRETTGSPENLELLRDPRSGVDAAFMTGWIERPAGSGSLLSLGVIFNSPIWIFYRADEPWDRLSRLQGKRIAAGPSGSASRIAALKILQRAGVGEQNSRFTDSTGTAAADALKSGNVDVSILISDFDSPAVQALIREPAVRLMDMPLAEALVRLNPELNRLQLPRGIFSIEPVSPSSDVAMVATLNRVLIRDTLHPAIVHEILKALVEVHGRPGIFHRAGEFPKAADPEYPLAANATAFYASGSTFWQRTLPIWLTAWVQRTLAALLAIAAIGIPLLKFIPRAVKWIVSERFVVLYRRMRDLETEVAKVDGQARLDEFIAGLDQIERDAVAVPMPSRYAEMLYTFLHHSAGLRGRLAARRHAPTNPNPAAR